MPHPGPDNRWRVPFDGKFRVARAATHHVYEDADDRLAAASVRLDKLQRKLYADDRFSLLLVFQAMDAAGKDGTIRAVMRGVDPTGCHAYAFKQPSKEELDHDFLWRIHRALPERGRIGIFNRSHYEEVLVVRVHPELLAHQRLDRKERKIFDERFDSIRDMERHLYRNGTIVVKFWLNVSKDEQRRRFLARIDDPDARWKFQAGDVAERGHWDAYMSAYQDALEAVVGGAGGRVRGGGVPVGSVFGRFAPENACGAPAPQRPGDPEGYSTRVGSAVRLCSSGSRRPRSWRISAPCGRAARSVRSADAVPLGEAVEGERVVGNGALRGERTPPASGDPAPRAGPTARRGLPDRVGPMVCASGILRRGLTVRR